MPLDERLSDAQTMQRDADARLWSRASLVRQYAGRSLRPAEVIALIRYRDDLAGRVLELGCGAGRLSGYLVELADEFHGIDVSRPMVEHCRRAYPGGRFTVGDLRDAGRAAGPYEAVFAPFNVLDVLPHPDRLDMLETLRHLVCDGGLLIMSSHNRAHAPLVPKPTSLSTRDPLRLAADIVRLPRRIRNARRLSRFQHEAPDHALLNDEAHDFAALHCYVSREVQERQLAGCGLTPLECLDLDGRSLGPGDEAPECAELHYIARAAS